MENMFVRFDILYLLRFSIWFSFHIAAESLISKNR